MDWFRSWHGAPTDTKWLVIAKRANVAPGIVSATAWALFDFASQAPDRGNVTGFDVEMYAVYSGFPEADISAVLTAMHDKAIIDDSGRLSSWGKRQPKREDDSAERVARYREKQRSVTQGNAPVTQGNAPDTDTDTDTDIDIEQNRTECVLPDASPDRVSIPYQATNTHTQEKPPAIAFASGGRTDEQKRVMSHYQDTIGQSIWNAPKKVQWLDEMTASAGEERMRTIIDELGGEIRAGTLIAYNALGAISERLKASQNGSKAPAKKDGRSPIIENDPHATGVIATVIRL